MAQMVRNTVMCTSHTARPQVWKITPIIFPYESPTTPQNIKFFVRMLPHLLWALERSKRFEYRNRPFNVLLALNLFICFSCEIFFEDKLDALYVMRGFFIFFLKVGNDIKDYNLSCASNSTGERHHSIFKIKSLFLRLILEFDQSKLTPLFERYRMWFEML